MPDLTARLLDPERFVQATEACMTNPYQAHLCIGFFAEAVGELHTQLRTAEAEGAAAREDVALYRAVARTGAIVRPKVDPRTTAAWFATGGEFSIFETGDTEAEVLRKAVAAIDSARAGGGR